MDRVTFDFETGEVIWDTDGQKGTEFNPDLAAKKEAILAAAGYESVDIKGAVRDFLEELGLDGHISV